jgi:hypothetical protein
MINQNYILWLANYIEFGPLLIVGSLGLMVTAVLWIVGVILQLKNRNNQIVITILSLVGGACPFLLEQLHTRQLTCDYIFVYFIISILVLISLIFLPKQKLSFMFFIPVLNITFFWLLFVGAEITASC